MFDKAKAVLLATALATSSVVSLSPNANAVNGNIYDWNEHPFTSGSVPSYYTAAQADSYCLQRRKTAEGYWSDGARIVVALNGVSYRVSKVINTWHHRNNQQCVITVVQ
jgi:hypothetical protein